MNLPATNNHLTSPYYDRNRPSSNKQVTGFSEPIKKNETNMPYRRVPYMINTLGLVDNKIFENTNELAYRYQGVNKPKQVRDDLSYYNSNFSQISLNTTQDTIRHPYLYSKAQSNSSNNVVKGLKNNLIDINNNYYSIDNVSMFSLDQRNEQNFVSNNIDIVNFNFCESNNYSNNFNNNVNKGGMNIPFNRVGVSNYKHFC